MPKVYPRWKYHRVFGGKIVKDALEEIKLGGGWCEDVAVISDPKLLEQIRIASTPAPSVQTVVNEPVAAAPEPVVEAVAEVEKPKKKRGRKPKKQKVAE